MDDDLIFADDDGDGGEEGFDMPSLERKVVPWKVMVVDDDEDVHAMTQLVLRNFSFESRPLEIISGYSGADAQRLMRENPDTAVLLLDVVMESDQAGLDAVQVIRQQLNNRFVRIILRTGQPGQAPEQDIITTYDINDYKEKTDLTEQKLITTIISSLRSYRDLRTIEKNKRGLEKILEATGTLFKPRSIEKLATGVLSQLVSILGLDESAFYLHSSGFAASQKEGGYILYAGTGRYRDLLGQPLESVVSAEVASQIKQADEQEKTLYGPDSYIGFFKSRGDSKNILFLNGPRSLSDVDRRLIEIYSSNVGLAFDNIYLNQEIIDTQKDITFTLGELIEARSNEAGNHIWRVAYGARFIAEKLALPEDEIDLLWLASPLHDLGKIGIPDQVLKKPGALEPDEWALMQDHANIGYQILKGSNRKILQVAATIAIQHHERWDGKGYPQGLKGEEIHLYARIIALLDVFDALSNDRCYKRAWERDRVLQFIDGAREKRFDPKLVDILLENLDDFYRIQERYSDSNRHNATHSS
ncbi:MAG: DUF3369 domain-containing protein [Magnetococcales bacterium]|nr:DUF3369 domain-containing protein [Magnetococcales bacterium]